MDMDQIKTKLTLDLSYSVSITLNAFLGSYGYRFPVVITDLICIMWKQGLLIRKNIYNMNCTF